MSEKGKTCPKLFFCAAILDHFQAKNSNLRPLVSITFPQEFQISIKFGHWTLGSGCKKTFKQSEKKWTDRHRDSMTESASGPIQWKSCKSPCVTLISGNMKSLGCSISPVSATRQPLSEQVLLMQPPHHLGGTGLQTRYLGDDGANTANTSWHYLTLSNPHLE